MKKSTILIAILAIELIIIVIGVLLISGSSKSAINKPSVLVIDVHGQIVDSVGTNASNTDYWERGSDFVEISTVDLLNAIKKYEKDDNVKAIILDIDSNGGGGKPMYDLIDYIRSMNKPVVSVIRDQALSGGYYIASSTKRIYANELSNIADIGYLTIVEYTRDHQNWKKCFITSSEYKGMYYDDCEGFERTEMYQTTKEELINETAIFARRIASFRNIPEADVQIMADGTIFTGIGALRLGLIDEIGGLHEAVDWLENQTGTPLEIVYLREIQNAESLQRGD